ncbi:MAG: hypothetical protein AB9M53_10285 [Leptothrix sp. (in: b-proteobacteria)]
MEWLIEIIVEVFGEFILQLVFEALAQAGLHLFKKPERDAIHPALLWLGYAVMGAAAGGLSLLVLPHYLLRAESARVAYLLLAPAAVGSGIAAIGTWRARRGQPRIGIDRWVYGATFAFAFALVRFVFADPGQTLR